MIERMFLSKADVCSVLHLLELETTGTDQILVRRWDERASLHGVPLGCDQNGLQSAKEADHERCYHQGDDAHRGS